MAGLIDDAALIRVFNSWRRAIRLDELLSRVAVPDLRPLADSFNMALTGEDDGQLDIACAELVKAQLEPRTVVRITTMLAETFADEVGTSSGAVTKSLVGTLGHVCSLLTATMVASMALEARRDGLTGLENLRAWEESLATALEGGSEVAVAMIDLDGLKAVNDSQGHDAGNAYLSKFAADLRNAIPIPGRVFRFGGDEFAVSLARVPAGALEALIDRFIAVPGIAPFSYGVSHTSQDGRDAETLVKVADERLYKMKAEHKSARNAGGLGETDGTDL
jgi:diguanylate cyclase (GGDEF)-like protein